MIDFEWITDKRFHVTHELVNTFEWNWERYVGIYDHFTCNIWNPICYIEQDIIKKNFGMGMRMLNLQVWSAVKKFLSILKYQLICGHYCKLQITVLN